MKVRNFVGVSENVSLLRYGVFCMSQQCVRPYLVFMAAVASLLVGKANEILSTTINRDLSNIQCVKRQLASRLASHYV